MMEKNAVDHRIRLEKTCETLSAGLENETRARVAQAEETGLALRELRSKLRGTADEACRLLQESFRTFVEDKLGKESTMHEVQFEAIRADMCGQKKDLEALRQSILDRLQQDHSAMFKEWQETYRGVVAELAISIRQIREEFDIALSSDRGTREVHTQDFKARLEVVESFMEDARMLFRDGLTTPWKRSPRMQLQSPRNPQARMPRSPGTPLSPLDQRPQRIALVQERILSPSMKSRIDACVDEEIGLAELRASEQASPGSLIMARLAGEAFAEVSGLRRELLHGPAATGAFSDPEEEKRPRVELARSSTEVEMQPGTLEVEELQSMGTVDFIECGSQQCDCGNYFVADALFCRMCGQQRIAS